jgi:hypothetical protein
MQAARLRPRYATKEPVVIGRNGILRLGRLPSIAAYHLRFYRLGLGLSLHVARKVVKSDGRIPNTLVFLFNNRAGGVAEIKKKRDSLGMNDKVIIGAKSGHTDSQTFGFPSGVVTLEGGNFEHLPLFWPKMSLTSPLAKGEKAVILLALALTLALDKEQGR